MILHSLSKHVKDQNWFAVALDFLIVVVGVFIGKTILPRVIFHSLLKISVPILSILIRVTELPNGDLRL